MANTARTAVFGSSSRWSTTMQPARRKLRAISQGERDGAKSGLGDRIHDVPSTSIGNPVFNVRSPPSGVELHAM